MRLPATPCSTARKLRAQIRPVRIGFPGGVSAGACVARIERRVGPLVGEVAAQSRCHFGAVFGARLPRVGAGPFGAREAHGLEVVDAVSVVVVVHLGAVARWRRVWARALVRQQVSLPWVALEVDAPLARVGAPAVVDAAHLEVRERAPVIVPEVIDRHAPHSSYRSTSSVAVGQVRPRMRGCDGVEENFSRVSRGSFPHARVRRTPDNPPGRRRRFIPACAGGPVAPRSLPVHPRLLFVQVFRRVLILSRFLILISQV